VRLERGPASVSLDRPVVAVGPEGGWSPAERQALATHAGLGPHVLRAETAAITAGALLGAMRSGLLR
jgi:16S rRNA (uracil1498-N3)-methyltransferase